MDRKEFVKKLCPHLCKLIVMLFAFACVYVVIPIGFALGVGELLKLLFSLDTLVCNFFRTLLYFCAVFAGSIFLADVLADE